MGFDISFLPFLQIFCTQIKMYEYLFVKYLIKKRKVCIILKSQKCKSTRAHICFFKCHNLA